MTIRRSVVALITVLAFGVPAWAQDGAGAGTPAAGAPAAAAAGQRQVALEDDPDLDIDPLQPDFTLIGLPTTLRMPRMKSAFRVTHRFTRSLRQGDFGSLASDFFGIDSGAAIGLEYRFGLMRGADVGIRRTNDRTIEFEAEYNLLTQVRNAKPIGLSAFASIDGTNNFRDSYSPALGVVLSRTLGRAGTVYVDPIWVNNSNPLPSVLADNNDSFLLGLGNRLRIRPASGRLRPRRQPGEFRIRETPRWTRLPDQFLERLRHDHGTDRARWNVERRLVSRLQYLAKVLLI